MDITSAYLGAWTSDQRLWICHMILHEVMISFITVNFHCPDTEAGKRRVKIAMW